MTLGNQDSGATAGVRFVTSTVGNTVGGLVNTVGGVTGAAGRGVGETIEGATGSAGKNVGRAIANGATSVENGAHNFAGGVKDAGYGNIAYTTRRLHSKTGKVSPTVEKLYLIYLGACEDYLARDGEECPGGSAKDVVKEIQFYEGQFSSQHRFALATDDATQQLQDERVKLRRLDIFARYSDYMKRISSNLTSRTSERTPDIGKASSDYQWSETSKKSKAEEPWWKEYGTTKGTEAVKTTYSIYKICRDCRIDLNKVIQAIHTYSGQTGHSLLDDLLRDANFHEIAITLQRDHKVLASIMPAGMGTEEEFIRTVILELCDRWFYINVADGGSRIEKPWS